MFVIRVLGKGIDLFCLNIPWEFVSKDSRNLGNLEDIGTIVCCVPFSKMCHCNTALQFLLNHFSRFSLLQLP